MMSQNFILVDMLYQASFMLMQLALPEYLLALTCTSPLSNLHSHQI